MLIDVIIINECKQDELNMFNEFSETKIKSHDQNAFAEDARQCDDEKDYTKWKTALVK